MLEQSRALRTLLTKADEARRHRELSYDPPSLWDEDAWRLADWGRIERVAGLPNTVSERPYKTY